MRILSDYVYRKAARIGSAVALAAVLIGVSVVPAAAQGRQHSHHDDDHYGDRHDDYDGRRMSSSEARRVAMINGYAEGYEHGVRDRQDRASFNYRHAHGYQQATEGYTQSFGVSMRDYQNAFRQGYAKGYSDGYYGRSRSRDYNRSGISDYRNSPVDPYANYPSYRRNPNRNNDRYSGNGALYNGRYYDDREGDLDREEVARRAAQQGYYDGFYRGQYDLRQGVRRGNPQGHGAYQFALNGWNPEWGSAQTFQQYYRQYFLQGYQDGFGRRQMNRRYSRRWW